MPTRYRTTTTPNQIYDRFSWSCAHRGTRCRTLPGDCLGRVRKMAQRALAGFLCGCNNRVHHHRVGPERRLDIAISAPVSGPFPFCSACIQLSTTADCELSFLSLQLRIGLVNYSEGFTSKPPALSSVTARSAEVLFEPIHPQEFLHRRFAAGEANGRSPQRRSAISWFSVAPYNQRKFQHV
jgi:hypothetical protein